MSTGSWGRRAAAVLTILTAAVVAAGCQGRVGMTGATVDLRLPPAQEVEIPLITDENEQPFVPDAIEGKKVFDANCAVCHGATGDGHGPMSAGLVAPDKDVLSVFLGLFGIVLHRPPLSDRPFPFANRDIESVVTPAILYETVTLGRAHLAMPAFGPEASFGANKAQTLTNKERWDANVYEMGFRTNPEELSASKHIYDQQCAVCHGEAGDGKGPRGAEMAAQLWSWARGEGPGIFTDANYMVQRNPSDLATSIQDGRGPMPSYRGKFTQHQVEDLVYYIYTFFYKHPPIK